MITMQEAFEAFLLAKKSENKANGTMSLYNWTMEKWIERWPGLSLTDTKPDHVRNFNLWIQESGIADTTVNIHFRNMRTILNWCVAEGLIDEGVLKNVKPPKVTKKVKDILTEVEAADMLVAVKASGRPNSFRDYTILLFFLVTGVRLNELSLLNVGDLNLAGGYAIVKWGKGRKERLVPLGDLLPLEVKRYMLKFRRPALPTEKALFINDEGNRLHKSRIQKLVANDIEEFVDRRLRRTGPHTLRHSAGTFMLRKLKDIKRVAMIMGHSDLETTEEYMHLTFDDLNNVQRPTLEQLITAKRGKRKLPMMLPESNEV